MKSILTLTMNPAVDKSCRVDRVIANKKMRCTPPAHEPGGGGINVSRAIRKLGGNSVAIYPAGGAMGEFFDDLVGREGVGKVPIPIKEMTRVDFTVSEEEGADQQFRFVLPGPELSEGEWKACLECLSSRKPAPDYIVASGSLPPGVPTDFYARLANRARHLGSRLCVDTSGEALTAVKKEKFFLLKPNRRELAQLSDREIENEEQEVAVAEELVGNGTCEILIVSLGAAGVMLVTQGGRKRLRAPDVTIKSRVGAGDSMMAGVVLALAREKNVMEAVRYGIAAGTAAVMTPGSELCRKKDTDELYRRLTADT
ncbi:MAG: 1-phosphofructokinase family hexose kinase [Opitutales bacterium]